MVNSDWYNVVRQYTERLVGISSISPGKGEIQAAQEVLSLLHEGGLGTCYTASGLDPIEGDPYGRQNAYAFLRGSSPSTLVLLGHIDTVDTQDYGTLQPLALDPTQLTARREELIGPSSDTVTMHDQQDWLFGRGVADMKSGVAVNIALMRRVAEQARTEPLALSIVMVATTDEECENMGVVQAVHLLLRLQKQYGLTYLGAINTDYVTALHPGDQRRYIYAGSIGKLLPSFFCIGRESHVGYPFRGLDVNLLVAELIRDLSMNDELCDAVPGQLAAPPVTLHATDLKSTYNVQLPFTAYFYLNVLTLTTTPAELLERLRLRAESVLTHLLQRVDEAERRWLQASNEQGWQERFQERSGIVLSYDELYCDTVQKLGEERLRAELAAEWERWPAILDKRERSLYLVKRLWALSERQGPAVVIYYSPPYIPAVGPVPGLLQEAITAVVEAHPEEHLQQEVYFPYLSDMSYLRLEPGVDLTALTANMPVWSAPDVPVRAGAYSLPLDAIKQLGMPAINWGPFGLGAHQRDEAVLMSYTFATLPQLLYETIERLAARV